MASVSVFACPGADQLISSDGVPSCAAGAGQWQSVVLQEPFDPASLNGEELGGAAGAGFLVVGVGLVTAGSLRLVFQSLFLGRK